MLDQILDFCLRVHLFAIGNGNGHQNIRKT